MKLSLNHVGKNLLLGSCLLLFAPTMNSTDIHPSSEVYICYSTTAKKYHYDRSCRGLSACKHKIVKISRSEAQNMGRTLCGWED